MGPSSNGVTYYSSPFTHILVKEKAPIEVNRLVEKYFDEEYAIVSNRNKGTDL